MNHGSGIWYASTESNVLIKLYIVRKLTGPDSVPNHLELSLTFKDKTGKTRYPGDLPDQNAVTAACKLAGIDPPIKVLKVPEFAQHMTCSCPDSVAEIELGFFLVYLVKYMCQPRLQ